MSRSQQKEIASMEQPHHQPTTYAPKCFICHFSSWKASKDKSARRRITVGETFLISLKASMDDMPYSKCIRHVSRSYQIKRSAVSPNPQFARLEISYSTIRKCFFPNKFHHSMYGNHKAGCPSSGGAPPVVVPLQWCLLSVSQQNTTAG